MSLHLRFLWRLENLDFAFVHRIALEHLSQAGIDQFELFFQVFQYFLDALLGFFVPSLL